ncbi:HlyD family efflux transporter periplasmic adaptor subunit [Candidatus Saccharibacteria bacterium]|nr:HlyD family efflux transporter periplasmic adaptor subunit [Candidatus Saccharibacteria bacterium]
MKFFARLRLLIGILVIIGLVGGLFIYLNYAMSVVSSRSASLESDMNAVSVEYGGIIKKQYVEVGTNVKKNDPLFELTSTELSEALRTSRISTSSLLFSVTPSGDILLRASNSGILRQVNFAEGAFVPANSPIATIALDGSEYVRAKYSLQAPDYARINRGNMVSVTLPDNTRLNAKVFDIALEQDGDKVLTIVKARFNDDASISPTFSVGTPVSTSWQLENNSWYTTMLNAFKRLIEPTTAAL